MEIFGIPILFIIFIAYLLWTNYAQEEKKKNEETAKRQQQEIIEIALRWDAISTGMNKEEILNRLGETEAGRGGGSRGSVGLWSEQIRR